MLFFFARYWRQCICLHPSFTLKNNFITLNAYMCIQINAHSLLALIFMFRDVLPQHSDCFTPWLLGSQSFEKTFRSLRSMTGTFSTIINFSMLGILQRLHKLSIKEELQSESEKLTHGISFPRLERNKRKDGFGSHDCFPLIISNEKIHDALKRAESKAKENMDRLGMARRRTRGIHLQ